MGLFLGDNFCGAGFFSLENYNKGQPSVGVSVTALCALVLILLLLLISASKIMHHD
jgi:hypothetical protein